MALAKHVVRLWWALLLLVFVATQLPGPLGHPYPTASRPYVVYGGLLIFVVGGLCLVAIGGRHHGSLK